MNHICTWVCVDEKGEESYFPQTGKLSSDKEHQDIYWRCVIVFFLSSKRFNRLERHMLFTNVRVLPIVDGRSVEAVLKKLGVEIVHTDLQYKTPRDYYFSFQNQFYEFSILDQICSTAHNPDDAFLILDSDCIFLKPVAPLFATAAAKGFISFEDDVLPDYVINGLSRNDMKAIFEDLLGHTIPDIPAYHLGEFFLASVTNIRRIAMDFRTLWPLLLERHGKGQAKFNEEAHTLSYLYYKNNLQAGRRDSFMKRIWTNPTFYRNVSEFDVDLIIWHLPAEKTYGLRKLYDLLIDADDNFGASILDDQYISIAREIMGVPHLRPIMRWRYYALSYQRALKKRLGKLSFVRRIAAAVN